MNMNSGYNGYSMSNRATSAYENGEKPFSKWTKAEILSALKSMYGREMSEKAKRLSVNTLKALALQKSSWHHTSKFLNKTDFYTVREDLSETIFDNIREEREEREEAKSEFALIKYIWKENKGSRKYPKVYTYSHYYIASVSEKSACILSKKREKCEHVKNYEIVQKLKCFPRKNNKVWKMVEIPSTEEKER